MGKCIVILYQENEHTFGKKKGSKNMFYVITYESGEQRHGNFNCYMDALIYAESRNGGNEFVIEEYDSEEDYENNL